MNEYLKHLNKIEFILTYACTGKCKHCSEGDHELSGEIIDIVASKDIIRKISSVYKIETVLVFGGEPLLYPDAATAILSAAREVGIPKRQIITNGYFSNDSDKIKSVAKLLAESGVNDTLLSVDAFHQETIPLEPVIAFAREAKSNGVPIRLQPAWLVSRDDNNQYNEKTREILKSFRDLKIPENSGNVIFPEGNAKKYLHEYFREITPENPYGEDPCNVKCLSFEPNGNVLSGNIYKNDIMQIIESYKKI